MRLVHGAADCSIACEQHRHNRATQRDGVLVPALVRRLTQVAAAEDRLAGVRQLDLHVLTATQPSLHSSGRVVGRDHCSFAAQLVQHGSESRSLVTGHQHAAQALAEAIDQQVDDDAPALGGDQLGQHADAIRVVLDVKGGQVQERSRLAHHRKPARPFSAAIPQRQQRSGACHRLEAITAGHVDVDAGHIPGIQQVLNRLRHVAQFASAPERHRLPNLVW